VALVRPGLLVGHDPIGYLLLHFVLGIVNMVW